MPDFPIMDAGEVVSIGAASGGGTSMTAGAANVKGVWAQLVAATTIDTTWVWVHLLRDSARTRYLVDIGIGANPNEVVIIPDLLLESVGSSADRVNYSYLFPLCIPEGSRIAARVACTTAAATLQVILQLVSTSFGLLSGMGEVVAYGASTADSGGTLVDANATANLEGTPVQITASTTVDHAWLAIGLGRDTLVTATSTTWHVDVMIGAGGAEQVLIPDIPMTQHATSDTLVNPTAFYPVSIPAGSRLSVRLQSSNAGATERALDVVLYGAG